MNEYKPIPIYDFALFLSRPVPPTQAEYVLPALGEPPGKRRERTTNNVKS